MLILMSRGTIDFALAKPTTIFLFRSYSPKTFSGTETITTMKIAKAKTNFALLLTVLIFSSASHNVSAKRGSTTDENLTERNAMELSGLSCFGTGPISCSVLDPPVLVVPFVAGAQDFYFISEEVTLAHEGNCGSGPVDGKLTRNVRCVDRGGECAVAFTREGEMLKYIVEAEHDVTVDLIFRASSLKPNKEFYVEVEGVSGGERFTAPGLGWDRYEDFVWEDVELKKGRQDVVIQFLQGNVNFCALSAREALIVPFEKSARNIDYVTAETTSEHFGACGSGILDGTITDDPVCIARGGKCAVGFFEAGEIAVYEVVAEEEGSYDIILRVSSHSAGKLFFLELMGYSKTFYSPGYGWDDYRDFIARAVPLKKGKNRIDVQVIQGSINLCSLSINKSSGTIDHVGGPIDFNLSALHFSGYVEKSADHKGNCPNVGPVDMKLISDTECYNRGADCAVAYTQPGEYLWYYALVTEDLMADITFRVASRSKSKRIFVQVEGVPGSKLWNSPGEGTDNYVDLTWEGALLTVPSGPFEFDVRHDVRRIDLYFLDGNVDFCALTVAKVV